MYFHRVSLFLSLFTTLSISSPLALELQDQSKEPLPPRQDPWYTAPPNFELSPPGTIFRLRRAPGNLTSVVNNCSAAYNILYRTTDTRYRPSWAVTTVLFPSQNSTSSQQNLLSLQVPYDTANVDASPSYLLYSLTEPTDVGIPSTLDDINPLLSRGWFVNIPDYEGPLASLAANVQAGHATIDSIRAVLSSGLLSGKEETKYALWGYSGGSMATEFAAELAVQYAPELFFSGAAVGGLVSNVSSAADNVTGSSFAGLIPSIINGVVSQYPDAESYLVSRLKSDGPLNATFFLSARNMTVFEDLAAFANQSIYDYFIGGRSDVFGVSSPIASIVNHNSYMGYHGTPTTQIFAYQAISDDLTPIKGTDALVQRYCGVGADIWFQRNTVGNHVSEITNGRQRALQWLDSIFDGTYHNTGCKIEDVTVNLLG